MTEVRVQRRLAAILAADVVAHESRSAPGSEQFPYLLGETGNRVVVKLLQAAAHAAAQAGIEKPISTTASKMTTATSPYFETFPLTGSYFAFWPERWRKRTRQ